MTTTADDARTYNAYRSKAAGRRDTIKQRRAFADIRRAEVQYGTILRKVARFVGDIARGFVHGDQVDESGLIHSMEQYASALRPFAASVARRMWSDVAKRDERAWRSLAAQMGTELQREMFDTPLGDLFQSRMQEQVKLITSLPLDAAERVHKLTIEARATGTRAKDIAEKILETGHVTKGRAMLIARTEVARTASELTQARAEYAGSVGYIWLTSHDSDVRPSHKKMEGKFVRWDDKPELDGMRGHAGEFPNCRCTPLPVLPGQTQKEVRGR